ncbi:Rieske 2Fe-2S domain-containing protein [Neosynechococcus sphagnicola]|uniref:aromatic ring-hydroxylating dioxygenase subunit alpha n=1 Tax=Neosynechococcus sphagnicola TaxID=1501145 RepID=UPI0009077316|nr:Rieske 2Fe-2S domain-containing protein [Neosynechococcus sphagnicola]
MLKNFWYAVELSHEVTQKPKLVTLMGREFVLYREPQGTVVALNNQCAHRGASLAGGWTEGNCIRCPYHGWKYQADGACLEIPANQPGVPIPKRARVNVYPAEEKSGFVWIYYGDQAASERPPVPDLLPELNDPNWRPVYGEYTWDAHYTRVIESNLDVSHAAYVHPPFFGNRDRAVVGDYEVRLDDYSATAVVKAPAPKRKTLLKYLGQNQERYSIARISVYMPTINRIEIDFGFRGFKYIYFTTSLPIDEKTTLAKYIGLRNFLKFPWADGNSRQNAVATYLEDQLIVKTCYPKAAPTDLKQELLVGSDGLIIGYRKLLRQYQEKGWELDEWQPTHPRHTHAPAPVVEPVLNL